MADPVKPALTAKEWAALPAPIKRPGVGGAEYVKMGPKFAVEGFREDGAKPDAPFADCDCGEVGIDHPETRHALAALALHGQPFGFTHEDADRLRNILFDSTWGAFREEAAHLDPGNLDAAYKWAESLADRIEALLPPRGTEP